MKNNQNFAVRLARTHFNSCLILLFCGLLFNNCKVNSGSAGKAKSIRTLMVGGGASHDFNQWYKQADAATLRRDNFATVRYTDNTDSIAAYLPQTDVLYLANNQPINNPQVRQAIFDFVKSGKGLVLGHAALWYNWKDWPEYNLQLASGGSRGHDRYGNFNVNIINTNHPVTKGVEPAFSLKDELYYFKTDPNGPGVEVLANASVAGSDRIFPSVFVVNNPQARIVGIALGHDAESHNITPYQTLLRNAIKWAAKK
ncbi:ThuA domain-containing protein [Adhaeribacter rhizoryzae]|uniref:ThuA domain-containing protein n=1 Tax=Adhaeribacter rhizoryzae TaxID=2607907 RepID=A0A5M6D769_9BACT|nr:ThuA domain-containing protein [Adhaeribacter rhizoryzae]KAA5541699.1 ThuA domain-containing protein [Adhaeribacter rhizoryzae]